MRRNVLAALAVVAGLALAGVSALSWAGDSDGDTAAPRSTATTSASSGPGGLKIPKAHPHKHTKPAKNQPRHHQGTPPNIRSAPPVRLALPSLGVKAEVFPIGADGSLTLVPPADFTTVGWWSPGPEPGDGQGTTILAGHTVHTGGGALDNLGAMEIGDFVRLDRPTQDVRYRVTSVTTYLKGTLARHAGQIFDQTGPERVALVTCGDWNGEMYLSNVVVIAEHPRPLPIEG